MYLDSAVESSVKALPLLERTLHKVALHPSGSERTMQHCLHVQMVFLLAAFCCHDDVFRDTQLLHEVQHLFAVFNFHVRDISPAH
jgi:hypothetical protein